MRLARAKIIAKTGVLRQSQNAPAGPQPSACRVPVVFNKSDTDGEVPFAGFSESVNQRVERARNGDKG
jgi:hypothetical protein